MSVKTVEDIVDQLNQAALAYAEGFPIMTDEEFDALEILLKLRDPKNDYFKEVGAPVRGAKTALPVAMGSLDQVYGNDLLSTVRQYWLTDDVAILTAKLDGASLLLEYVDGVFKRALTRGDGYEGQDVTQIFTHCECVPKKVPGIFMPNPLYIRAEAIFTESDFKSLNEAGKLGRTYKNARNYVAGQLNRQYADAESVFVKNIHVIAYQIFGDFSKSHQLDMLRLFGFEIAENLTSTFESLDESKLERVLRQFKSSEISSKYAIDGVVVDVDANDTRVRLAESDNRGSINPNFQWKFKINDNRTITTVVDVEWNISKNGYLKPRVQVEPVELAGVTISFATGFNAKFIYENKIGPGAVVQVCRAGDVIPYLERVVSAMPIENMQ